MNFGKICNMIFRNWGGGVKGRLELFRKFIRFAISYQLRLLFTGIIFRLNFTEKLTFEISPSNYIWSLDMGRNAGTCTTERQSTQARMISNMLSLVNTFVFKVKLEESLLSRMGLRRHFKRLGRPVWGSDVVRCCSSVPTADYLSPWRNLGVGGSLTDEWWSESSVECGPRGDNGGAEGACGGAWDAPASKWGAGGSRSRWANCLCYRIANCLSWESSIRPHSNWNGDCLASQSTRGFWKKELMREKSSL